MAPRTPRPNAQLRKLPSPTPGLRGSGIRVASAEFQTILIPPGQAGVPFIWTAGLGQTSGCLYHLRWGCKTSAHEGCGQTRELSEGRQRPEPWPPDGHWLDDVIVSRARSPGSPRKWKRERAHCYRHCQQRRAEAHATSPGHRHATGGRQHPSFPGLRQGQHLSPARCLEGAPWGSRPRAPTVQLCSESQPFLGPSLGPRSRGFGHSSETSPLPGDPLPSPLQAGGPLPPSNNSPWAPGIASLEASCPEVHHVLQERDTVL